jgi:hypothetical protein
VVLDQDPPDRIFMDRQPQQIPDEPSAPVKALTFAVYDPRFTGRIDLLVVAVPMII